MSRYLCISVTFLDPLFHGQGDDGPEWPPSPMRLFQALLAGARTGCRAQRWSSATADAFRWLERRAPPSMVAPEARIGSGCILFVPNNDSDKEPDRQERLTSKMVHPRLLAEGCAVHYLWRIDESEWPEARVHTAVLCQIARQMVALGWGIDQVVGNGRVLAEAEAAALPGQRWRPWEVHRPGAPTWRVPEDGSLDDLERVHQAFVTRMESKQYLHRYRRYRAIHYSPAGTLPARHYAVFELPEGVAFRQEITATVAAMLRSLAIRQARADTHQFPGGAKTYVAGHTGQQEWTPPRFSFFPLPTIGHPNADGMVRRLLIAEPFGGDGRHAQWAQQRLRNAALQDEHGNERGVLLDLWRAASRSLVQRYVSCAREWSTVTPVILPGFDDGRHAKAEKLLMTAIRQADIPLEAVAELTIRKAPFWPGSQHPRQYAVPAYLKHLPGWHVRLVFKELIPGPLAIGAGRHAGLGLFAGDHD